MIESDVFKKALSYINQFKPGVFPGCGFRDDRESNNRLHEIRGWELYHARLLSSTHAFAQKESQELPEITYPDIEE